VPPQASIASRHRFATVIRQRMTPRRRIPILRDRLPDLRTLGLGYRLSGRDIGQQQKSSSGNDYSGHVNGFPF
jgi:hypothetical protein